METQNQTHPSRVQLAALALGKLTADSQARLQEHVASCSACSKFATETPRDALAALLREARSPASLADLSTPGVRDAGTVAGISDAVKSGRQPTWPPTSAPDSPMPPGSHQAVARERLNDADVPRALREQTKYRIVRLLGRGGMGSVYEAHHVRMDRRVAIKTINPSLLDHPDALLRFDQEVKAAAKLDHANVARAYDADEFGALRVLVMEYVPGQSLDKFLAQRKQLSVVEACRLVRQAMVGLQHAHDRGMVHRDLKPQNLMLTPDGKVKILDFGLAKIASERRAAEGLTRENALMGTPHYLAPEQALDAAKADIRADIYSLGCTLYCLLTGSPPFSGDTEMKVLLAHQNDAPQPLCEVRPHVPRDLSDLVDRMLAKNPADRQQTPKEAAQALLPFAKSETVVVTEPVTHALAFLDAPSEVTLNPTLRRPGSSQRPPSIGMWTYTSGGVVLTLLLAAWAAGVFSLRTAEGTIVVEHMPADANVLVDGHKVTFKRNSEEVTIEAVPQGDHKLKITRGGKDLWSGDVTIEFGGQRVPVKYVAHVPRDQEQAKNRYPDAEIVRGEWRVEGEELVQPHYDGEGLLAFGDPNWSRYNLTLQAQAAAGYPNFKISWHYLDRGNYRIVDLRESNDGVNTIFKNKWGQEALGKGTTRLKKWHNVRLEVRGTQSKCLLDDRLVFDTSDPQITSGRLALGGAHAEVRFRNIKVTSVDGKTLLWKGNPKVPPIGEIPFLAKAPPQDKPLRVVDLMRYVDPQKDTIEGTWTKDGAELRSDDFGPARLRIPYAPPEEYNFRMVFTRLDGRGDVNQVISHAGRNCMLLLGAFDNTLGGFALINGRHVDDNPTTIRANGFLRNGKKYTAVVYVRKGLIAATVDGRLIAEYKTDLSDIRIPDEWGVGNDLLGVTSYHSPTIVHAMEIEEVTANGRPVDLPPAGDVAALNSPAPNDKPQRVVNLLPMVELPRDAVLGAWTREGSELRSDGTQNARVRIRYQPPQEYDLRTEFTRTGGRSDVVQLLSHGGHSFFFTLGHGAGTCGGFGLIGEKWPGDNAAVIAPGVLRNGRKYSVVIHVRKGLIATSVDGRLVAEHETNFSDLTMPVDWAVGEGALGVGSWASPVTFHKIEIAEITGEGTPLRQNEANAGALLIKAQNREAKVVGDGWTSNDDELIQTSTGPHSYVFFGDELPPNYDLRLKAKAVAGTNGFIVLFNATDERTFRWFELGAFGNREHLYVSLLGEGKQEADRETRPGTIERDRWYDIRVEVRGTKCHCLLDGVTWFKKNDGRPVSGRVGVGSVGTVAHFKEIVITDEHGAILWQGSPQLSGAELPKNEIDSVTEALEAAKQAHKQKVDILKDAVLKSFEKKENAARTKGSKQDLEKLTREREAFATNEILPTLVQTGDYERKLNSARTALAEDYRKAIQAYEKDKREKEAAAARSELETIERPLSRRGDKKPADGALPVMQRFPVAEILGSPWTIEGEELVQPKPGDRGKSRLIFGDPDWSKYVATFSVQAAAEGTGEIRCYFHYREVETYRVFDLGAVNNSAHELTGRIDNIPSEPPVHQSRLGKTEPGRWYDVKLIVDGARCRALLDGTPWLEQDDARLISGRIGFGGAGSAIRVRNIVVTSRDGKTILWQGNPKLPNGLKAGAAATPTDAGGFVSLFNDKDLAGWNTYPSQPGALGFAF